MKNYKCSNWKYLSLLILYLNWKENLLNIKKKKVKECRNGIEKVINYF